jgi:ketosteroid isomerase-like protein
MTVEERLRALYDRFMRGDMDGAVELVDPDVVVVDAPELPGGRTYHGRAEVAGALRELHEMFDGPVVEIRELRMSPERVLVLLSVHGRGQGSGVPLDADLAHVFRVREDSIVEMLVFLDHATAVAEFQSG